MEDWKSHAEELKRQGNEAFESGDLGKAEQFYTQAIEVNPDDHVFYSNRSACYMKAGSISKALKDAEKCVELAPAWSKGYSRLGVAQQALKRFDTAIDTFKKGIELDSSNLALLSALRTCEEARETAKQQRYAEAAIERAREETRLKEADESRQRAAENKKESDDLLASFLGEVAAAKQPNSANPPAPVALEEDALLSSFFSEVKAAPVVAARHSQNLSDQQPQKTDVPSEVTAAAAEEATQAVAHEKYTNQDLGDGKTQHMRLTAKNCEWRNLNPYYVLQLDTDATTEDIKIRYRKLSARVHPDKNLDIANARESFEFVKAAYQKLLDMEARKVVVMNIEYVREETAAERKRLLAKGATESSLPPLQDEVERQIMKHFADIEMSRRRSEQVQRSHNTREKLQEKEEENKARRAHAFEKDWSQEDRREKRIGNWREFQDPGAKRARTSSYKPEKREEKKG